MQISSPAEQLIFATVRIETLMAGGGTGVGTGFLYAIEVDEKESALFLVTNKHVIDGARTGILTFTLSDGAAPLLGQHYSVRLENFANFFVHHELPDVDVALMPFFPILTLLSQRGVRIFFRSVPDKLIPTVEDIDELDAIEDVIFVGYPNGIWDVENNLPVVRRGITATPIGVDFRRAPQFLIDASVFPGSSGSPVFLFNNTGTFAKKGKGTVVGGRIMFLGLVASVFFREDTGRIEMTDVPTAVEPIPVVRQMIDLGVVFKATTVREVALRVIAHAKEAYAKGDRVPAAEDRTAVDEAT